MVQARLDRADAWRALPTRAALRRWIGSASLWVAAAALPPAALGVLYASRGYFEALFQALLAAHGGPRQAS